MIEEPRVSEGLVDFTDLFPTFAEVAGAPAPDGWMLDGLLLVPVLAGNFEGSREWVFSQRGCSRIIRNQRFKLDSDGGLFDLEGDPLEKHDLRDSTKPEIVAARQRLAKVLKCLPLDAPAPFEGYLGTLRRRLKARR